jgi:hypothetical protein
VEIKEDGVEVVVPSVMDWRTTRFYPNGYFPEDYPLAKDYRFYARAEYELGEDDEPVFLNLTHFEKRK